MLFKRKEKKEIRRDIHGRPIIDEKKKKEVRKSEEIIENKTISNIIAPMGITFNRNNLIMGDNLARCYGVIRYPQYTDYGWLQRLTSIHGTVAAIQFSPLDNVSVLKTLNTSIRNYRMDVVDGQKDPLVRQRAEQSVANAEEAMRRIDQYGEVAGKIGMVIMPIAENERDFEKICRLVENSAMIANCKVRKMANEQKEAVQFAWPTYVEDNNVYHQTKRLMLMSSFVGGFPFAASGWNDDSENSYYRGHDGLGGSVWIDSWMRFGDRTNSNYVIAGDSGQGKSATIKSMAIMEYALGSSIFFIDPEGEYKDLALKLGGEWLNASGGNGKVINPLQILHLPSEDDEDSNNDLEKHIKNIEVFLRLYIKDISQKQLSLLKKIIEDVYLSFNITWDTDVSQLKNDDFPVFKDVYEYAMNVSKQAKLKNEIKISENYQDIALLLRDIAVGSDSFLWGHHTTLAFTSEVVCVDTFGLNSSPDNIKAAQYFLLQNLAWQKATSTRNRSIIVYDEAHMIIDKDVPQPMKTLSQQERRARKYETAIWVASQQVNDFIDPEIKLYGQAIIDQPTYKVILGMSGQGLNDLTDLYSLKSTERELVEQKIRGRALFMIGNKRIDLSIKIDDFKLKYFGEAGGR